MVDLVVIEEAMVDMFADAEEKGERAEANCHATRLLIFSHVACSARYRASFAILDLKLVFEPSSSTQPIKVLTSRDATRYPLRSCSTISLGPPSSRAITGRPLAMASRTTSPKVSVMEEWTNTSEDA